VIREAQRRALNKSAVWVPDGCKITPDMELIGEARKTDIDSYQLSCVAAGYAHWPKLLRDYGVAILDYQRTGLETGIKETVNLHQGRAYLPFALQGARKAGHELQKRAEDQPQGYVPRGVRFLTAQVDVQAGKRAGFVVKVQGWGPHREHWTIDRFHLRHSERIGEDGRPLLLDPAAYVEDWRRLVDKVITRRYPLADGSGRTMPVRVTLCDMGGRGEKGGEVSVTSRAYDFWRQMDREGLGKKFLLVKGSNNRNALPTEIRYPNSRGRKDSKSGAAGDVPVIFVNTDQMKDTIANDLKRDEPGPGYWHFPDWMPTSAYDELTAETRTERGWVNVSGRHNEELDLCVYGEAAWCEINKPHQINWNNPPSWARDWDENPDVRRDDEPEPPPPRVLRRGVRTPGVQL
jgi:phage terminase large subunit GpA-like protein